MSLELRVKQQREEIEELIKYNKELAKENDRLKEEIERLETELMMIR